MNYWFYLGLTVAATLQAGPPQPLWATKLQGDLTEKLALSADGTIYGASGLMPPFPGETSVAFVQALTPKGSNQWQWQLPDAGLNGPTLGANGAVYISTFSLKTTPAVRLLALTNGVIQWQLPFSWPTADGDLIRSGSPAIASDGTIWFPAGTNLFTVRPDGFIKQTFSIDAPAVLPRLLRFSSSLVVAPDDTVYATLTDGRLIACRSVGDQISKLWEFPTAAQSWYAPALAPDGAIIACPLESPAFGGRLIALNPNGSLKWDLRLGARPGSPVIGGDGTVYTACENGRIYAFHPDGTPRWEAVTDEVSFSVPVLDAAGALYLLGNSGRLYALSREGSILSTNALGKYGLAISLSTDGTLLAATGPQTLQAFAVDKGLAADGWPMLAHDPSYASRSTAPALAPNTPPAFQKTPQPATVISGSALNLTAASSAAGAYYWRKDGANIPGQTNASLTFTNIALADEGWYSVILSNSDGWVSSTAARVTVLPSPGLPVRPLPASGWNVDVIREAAAPSAAFAFSNLGDLAALQNTEGSSWFESGFRGSTNGLPSSGQFVSALHANIQFQFQPYTLSNVLKLTASLPRASLTLASPVRLRFLSVLAASTLNGGGIGELTLNFADGTASPPLPLYAEGWNVTSPRLALGGLKGFSKIGSTSAIYADTSIGFGLHETDFDLAALGLDAKPIVSVTFTKPGYRSRPNITGIFAISGTPVLSLQSPRKTAARQFQFDVDGFSQGLRIETSSDLRLWQETPDLLPAVGTAVTDPDLTASARRFFRVMLSD